MAAEQFGETMRECVVALLRIELVREELDAFDLAALALEMGAQAMQEERGAEAAHQLIDTVDRRSGELGYVVVDRIAKRRAHL